jgi:hypothetical protein
MARMTEEEAWALDDEVTRNPPNVTGKPPGLLPGPWTKTAGSTGDQKSPVDPAGVKSGYPMAPLAASCCRR